MPVFYVGFTYDINGQIDVKAKNEKEAEKKVEKLLEVEGFDGCGKLHGYEESDRTYQTTFVEPE